ncbi:Cell division protein FtsL [Frondihabitans sp. 762G35]|uniref:FtsB family cell division protein n=1 Tax=Frondihabitans sp. 762G35 TaxID=1446794 RepID=UPI000D22485A|nr:septum formation initiator family protein [Frondihabitans sp. 762G35]ARC56207.1 Cell division protein FtsL [Frondihabitans sp. 762G35]
MPRDSSAPDTRARPGAARGTAATTGPAGTKNRRVPVSLPAMESAAGGFLRGMRFSGFSLLMLVIIVLFVVVLAPSLKTLIQQQEQISQLKRSVAAQEADVDSLKDDVARWNDPAYIEAQARDRLLYVYPGEYSYLVMNPTKSTSKATTKAGSPITRDIQNPNVDWVSGMLSSVYDAGLTTKPAPDLVAPDITGTK